MGDAEQSRRIFDRQEERQLRALPRRHPLRRAYVHGIGDRVLGSGRQEARHAVAVGSGSDCSRHRRRSGTGAPPAPVRKAHALGHETTQAAAATPAATAPADVPAGDTGQVDAAPTQPVEQIAAPDEAPPVAPAVQATTVPAASPSVGSGTTGAIVETGALQAGQALPLATAQPTQKPAPISSDKDRAAAAAAASSAAAAAERAAMAAETAANAAREAAAAAVAASAASRAGATVPPLDHASGAKPSHTE
ncbi:MAG: hypothetical protein WDN31_09645 [Hyphomicrobium sp.]